MKPSYPLSNEYLNAFVDGELSPAERARAIEQISGDGELKDQVCELQLLKEMVKSGYRYPAAVDGAWDERRRPVVRQALVACCLVLVGILAGWLGRALLPLGQDYAEVASLKGVIAQSDRIVLHLDAASPEHFERALGRAERFLVEARRDGRDIRVHLLANSNGLNLFRASTSPYAQRIGVLQQQYPNLTMMGCGQTIRRLKERSQDVRLLPEVQVVPAVLDEVVNNLKSGWTYIKV